MAFGKGLIARGSTYFVFGSKAQTQKPSMKAIERFIQLKTLLPAWHLFTDVSQMNTDAWKSNYNHMVGCFQINDCFICKIILVFIYFAFQIPIVLRIET